MSLVQNVDFSRCGEIKRLVMGLDRFNKTPCGFCFVEYYTHQDALDCLKYVGGTKLDERIIRADLDPGFEEGRQYGYVIASWGLPLENFCRATTRLWTEANFCIADVASLVDRFVTSTVRNTTPAVVVMAVHTMSSANERRNNTAREGKVCFERRHETVLEPENGVCLLLPRAWNSTRRNSKISRFI